MGTNNKKWREGATREKEVFRHQEVKGNQKMEKIQTTERPCSNWNGLGNKLTSTVKQGERSRGMSKKDIMVELLHNSS